MHTTYSELIHQSFRFPQAGLELKKGNLQLDGIDLVKLVECYGSPLKFTFLPKIAENVSKAKSWFATALEKHKYQGKYHYCYCTKSSHFKHVLHAALAHDVHLETSSAFDVEIVKKLKQDGRLQPEHYVICNGFKRDQYIENVAELIEGGHGRCIPVIDNTEELSLLTTATKKSFDIGIRIASEEEPKFEFYTSRLGIGYQQILPFYRAQVAGNAQVKCTMLHFFVNTGIRDTTYYWNELRKCLSVYVALKKECPSLSKLNIGGGFPIPDSLDFAFDYAGLISEIVGLIKTTCEAAKVVVPDIFTEFGSFTVGQAGGTIFKVLGQKQQNDREKWNMIDSSFITTLPDTWALDKRFLMLPLNRWDKSYERVLLGGLTCDSDDYYNSEKHQQEIFMPKHDPDDPLYIGFFNTGAYQESIGGFGGIQHCLIPQPKHLIIDKNENGELEIEVFAEQQGSEEVLRILGY